MWNHHHKKVSGGKRYGSSEIEWWLLSHHDFSWLPSLHWQAQFLCLDHQQSAYWNINVYLFHLVKSASLISAPYNDSVTLLSNKFFLVECDLYFIPILKIAHSFGCFQTISNPSTRWDLVGVFSQMDQQRAAITTFHDNTKGWSIAANTVKLQWTFSNVVR